MLHVSRKSGGLVELVGLLVIDGDDFPALVRDSESNHRTSVARSGADPEIAGELGTHPRLGMTLVDLEDRRRHGGLPCWNVAGGRRLR